MEEEKIDVEKVEEESLENEKAEEESIERSCINCNYLDGLDCTLGRDEEFEDGEGCPKYIPWWD